MARPAVSSSSSIAATLDRSRWTADAVICDIDGLLIDTERLYREAFLATAASFNVIVRDSAYERLIGVATPERIAILRCMGLPVEAFTAAYVVRKREMLANGVRLKPGAAAMLEDLAARGVPLAAATSASAATAERLLRDAALQSLLPVVATRDDVPRGKPFPDVFIYAARELAVRPERCVALEDSAHGVAAAAAAGMAAIMVPDLARPTDLCRARARAVVVDLHAAWAMLRPMFPVS